MELATTLPGVVSTPSRNTVKEPKSVKQIIADSVEKGQDPISRDVLFINEFAGHRGHGHAPVKGAKGHGTYCAEVLRHLKAEYGLKRAQVMSLAHLTTKVNGFCSVNAQLRKLRRQ